MSPELVECFIRLLEAIDTRLANIEVELAAFRKENRLNHEHHVRGGLSSDDIYELSRRR